MPGAGNDPTVRLPARPGAGGTGYPNTSYPNTSYPSASYPGTGTGAPANPWPSQPPMRSAPGGRSTPKTYSGGRRPRRPRLRLMLAFLAGLVVMLLILVIGGYFYLDGKLNRPTCWCRTRASRPRAPGRTG